MNQEPNVPDDPPFLDEGLATSRVRADIAALTHQGSRANNEDAFVVCRLGRFMERIASNLSEADVPARLDDSSHLLIVGDGMGGMAGGEEASRTAMTSLVDQILHSPKWALKLDDPATRESEIQELVERSRAYLQGMHARIRERQRTEPGLARMGTTFTSAYAVGNDLFVMHVGDSRAYVLRGERLFRITRDHTVAQAYVEMGQLDPDEAEEHPLSHVLTRALGGPDDVMEGDAHHRGIESGDRLLLCSDGLSKVVREDEVASVLLAHPVSADACRALVELALERGAPDNVTVIVAGFTFA